MKVETPVTRLHERLKLAKPDVEALTVAAFYNNQVVAGRAIIEGTPEEPKVWVIHNEVSTLYWVCHDPDLSMYPVPGDAPLAEVIKCAREIEAESMAKETT